MKIQVVVVLYISQSDDTKTDVLHLHKQTVGVFLKVGSNYAHKSAPKSQKVLIYKTQNSNSMH
jgi:hypothetical protein